MTLQNKNDILFLIVNFLYANIKKVIDAIKSQVTINIKRAIVIIILLFLLKYFGIQCQPIVHTTFASQK